MRYIALVRSVQSEKMRSFSIDVGLRRVMCASVCLTQP